VRPRKRRKRRRTPGVTPIPPMPERGKLSWSLKWRDPSTRQWRYQVLPGVTVERVADQFALRKSVELDAAKRAIEVNGRCAARLIADECDQYLREASRAARKGPRKGKPMSPITVARYTAALDGFKAWCESRGLKTLQHLTRDKLSEWSSSCLDRPTPNGRERLMSTVNFELKPIRSMLLLARGKGRFESLDGEAIASALERYPEAKPEPKCLSVSAIRAVLRAVIERDSARREHAGPAFALGLLGGLRRAETLLTVGNVRLNEPGEYDSSATHAVLHVTGKTGARVVELLPYSPLLLELLTALVAGRADGERLHDLDYEQIGAESAALARLGGELEGFAFKTLRSTCASYQGPLAGDLKAKADRLGHRLAVAETYYLARPRGLPHLADSLDALMQCEPELRAIIDAVKRPHGRRASRAQHRARS